MDVVSPSLLEELETLQAIYGDDFEGQGHTCKIVVPLEEHPTESSVILHILFPTNYPECVPRFTLEAEWLCPDLGCLITSQLNNIAEASKGEPSVFKITDYLRTCPFGDLSVELVTPARVVPEPAQLNLPDVAEAPPMQGLMDPVEREALIEQFINDGFVVVPIFSPEEVEEMRNSFHKNMGVDHDLVLAGDPNMIEKVGLPRAKSKAASIYYPKWKIDAFCDPRIVDFVTHLMKATFASGKTKGFEHPFGPTSDLLLFLDGCQYRLPDSIRAEGGLGLHLDRNPVDPFLDHCKKKMSKWRPIQSWIALTDQFGCDCGGLRVVRGFHKEIEQYFKRVERSSLGSEEELTSGGEFFRLNPTSHANLWKRLEPVNAPAGSIVLWDNRIVHATAEKLESWDTREVLFSAFVPDIELNKVYIHQQLANLKKNLAPPAFFDRQGRDTSEHSKRDWEDDDLTEEQKRFLGYYC